MNNFEYYNPVKVVFGKGTIAELKTLIPENSRVMMLYGGGSIKKNGVYEQVTDALEGYDVTEFSGIEANPDYKRCMEAVEVAKKSGIDFLLAVGGGSVIDAAKFIAAAVCFEDGDPWRILSERAGIKKALSLGTVLTIPATGSEMNSASVISRRETKEKLAFMSPEVFPVFSILDPETTRSLPERQIANGIVDAFAHVFEQYLTYDVNSPLQDRQSEAILLTLIEQGPQVLADSDNDGARANIMWCATSALNDTLSCSVPQDWSSHMIGHELTAHFGLDHGQSLAVVFPAVLAHQIGNKGGKLARYARRVFGVENENVEESAKQAIEQTVAFFRSLGMKTKLSEYGFERSELSVISEKFKGKNVKLGERALIGEAEVLEILEMAF